MTNDTTSQDRAPTNTQPNRLTPAAEASEEACPRISNEDEEKLFKPK